MSLEATLEATIASQNPIVSANHSIVDDCTNLATVGGKVALVSIGCAWHGRGTQVDRLLDRWEAQRLGQLDFVVQKDVVFMDWYNAETKQTENVLVPGVYAVWRINQDGSRFPLSGSSVGEDYVEFQNSECFDLLDGVLGEGGRHYETAGALGDGNKVFITAKISDQEIIAGDVTTSYLGLYTRHDGLSSCQVFFTNTRMVCSNTVAAALSSGSKFRKLRHVGDTTNRAKDMIAALSAVKETNEAHVEQCREMAKTACDPKPFFNYCLDDVLNVTAAESELSGDAWARTMNASEAEFEIKAKQHERRVNRRQSILDEILEIHDSETNTAPGTVWSAYNSVTEYANHHLKYQGNADKQRDTRMESILDGRADEYNQAALSHAVEMIAS